MIRRYPGPQVLRQNDCEGTLPLGRPIRWEHAIYADEIAFYKAGEGRSRRQKQAADAKGGDGEMMPGCDGEGCGGGRIRLRCPAMAWTLPFPAMATHEEQFLFGARGR